MAIYSREPFIKFLKTLLLVTGAALLAACAGSQDWQASDEALSGNPTAMLEDGQDAVRRGETLIDRGEDRITDGRRTVREGDDLLQEGNDMITDARQAYQLTARTSGSATTPAQVELEADRLQAISRRWEGGVDMIARGNRLIETGNERINRGQSEVRDGQALVESGRSLLRNAQSAGIDTDVQQ